MQLIWTDEARRSVSPHTKDAVTPRKPPGVPQLWEEIKKPADAIAKRFDAAIEIAAPGLRELLAAARDLVAQPAPPATFDPDVAAASIVMLEIYQRTNPILDVVIATDGLSRGVDVFVRSHAWEAAWAQPSARGPQTLVPTRRPNWSRGESLLRPALMLADEATYASCRQVAADAWPSASLGAKTAIAYRFLREQAWASEVARAWLEAPSPPPPPTYLLNSCVGDYELTQKLWEKAPSPSDLMNILSWHGEKAFPLVLAALRHEGARWDLKPAAAAASLFESDEIAKAFAELLGKAQVRTRAATYFARFPHLAKDALAPVAMGKTRAAAFAQEILAQVERSTAKAAPNDGAREAEADASELPEVLANPPWCKKKRPKRDVVVVPNAQMLARDEKVDAASVAHATGLKMPGETVTDQYATFVAEKWASWYCAPQILLGVRSPKLSLPMAKLADSRWRGKIVWEWFEANLDLAIVGLVPAAVGEPGPARKTAEQILRRLAARGKKAAIERVAKEHGGEVERGLLEILSWDPHYDCPKSPPKLPPACKLDAFTTPRLKNGKPLSAEAVRHIAEMLSFTLTDAPYVGLAEVRDACDERSLAAFAWDMARAWELAGAKRGSEFMLYALAYFADDEVTRRTTPAIKDRRILDVLRLIGTEAAAIELATIAARATVAPSAYVSDPSGAERMLEEIARERGVTKDELDDRLRPTTKLDEEGLSLDFGARRFTIAFDSKLLPVAIDEEKKRYTTFPAKRKTDDPAKVKLAQMKWNDLREDVSAIGARRVVSLERAMSTRRWWDAAAFRSVWLETPFVLPLAQAVVWTTSKGNTFRVAEDLSLSDEHDRSFTLPDNARIGVAHPKAMGAETVERWRALLQEYELIQPFPQLERVPADAALTATELDAVEITRPPPPNTPANTLVHRLRGRGFSSQQGGPTWKLSRALPSGATIEAQFAMAVPVGPLTIRVLRDATPMPFREADPVDVFEALRDIQAP
jgi:hypothetical protein